MTFFRVILILIFMTSLSGLTACGVGTSNAQESSDASVPVVESANSVLFVQSSNSGHWEPLGDGQFLLTLTSLAPNVVAFTDRPDRLASTLSNEAFSQQWASFGFNQSPPNAALVVHDAPVNKNTLIIELSDPQIAGETIQYTASVLPTPGGTFAQFGADEELLTNFERASLFIDNATANIFTPLKIVVNNAQPGQNISAALTANGASIAFSTGASFSASAGLQLTAQEGDLPLQSMYVTASDLKVSTSSQSGGEPLSFAMSLYLIGSPGIDTFYLASHSDPGIEIYVSIGNSEPQPVNEFDTLFSWPSN